MNFIYNTVVERLNYLESNIKAMENIWETTQSEGKYMTLSLNFMRGYLPKEAANFQNELNQIKKLLKVFPEEFQE